MDNVLFVSVYPGELGWELINYAPHICYLVCRKKYKQVHIMVREGRQAIYPMGTHFYPINLDSSKSMGNNGPRVKDSGIPAELSKHFSVDEVKTPSGGCKYIKKRKYIKYKATDAALYKWRHIPKNSVVLCIRGRRFGNHKNWENTNWSQLCQLLLKMNFTPVITGTKESVVFDPPAGCLDLWGSTTIDDLIAVMQKSLFAIGQSTGPMHLASLSGVPHAVWGTPRIQDRYLNTWNPHKTLVEYFACKKFISTYEDVAGLVHSMVKKIGLADAHCF